MNTSVIQSVLSTRATWPASTIPNVETILRIHRMIGLPIFNASRERLFSVLKRVKNYIKISLIKIA